MRDVFGETSVGVLSESRLGTLNQMVCWTPQSLAKKPLEGTRAEEKVCNIKLGSYSRKASP